MKKASLLITTVSLCLFLHSCITTTILSIIFPNNETIQNINYDFADYYFDRYPPRLRNCVISHMTMCFGNDSTNTFERVRTDGFYYYPKKHKVILADTIRELDSEDPWGQEIYRTVFYTNRMFGGYVFFEDDLCGASEWGMYEIHGDTIITECMTYGSMNGASYGFRDSLLVKSPDTLVLLSRSPICPEFGHENYFHYYTGERGDELYFMPCNRLPNQDKSWIKRKKWFWCDENEWREYKEARKKSIRLNEKQ